MSNILWPHGLQHASLLCPSQSPRVCSNSCPLSRWCYLIISSFATPFSFCLQFFSNIKIFLIFISNKLALHIRWPEFWSFSFNSSVCNGYSRLISFKIDWFDLLAVQGTLKSLLQHHNSKVSILWHSVFFMSQFSHLYMSPGEKTNKKKKTKKHSFDYMDLSLQNDVSAF